MTQQDYLDLKVNQLKLLNETYSKLRLENIEIFKKQNVDNVREYISSLSEDDLFKYFNVSQMSVDLQNMYLSIYYIYDFCKKTNSELDISKIEDIPNLLNFMTNYQDETEFVIDDNKVIIKDEVKFQEKFKEFKKTLENPIF